MKLNNATLPNIAVNIARPKYNRSHLQQAIVHIGVGGFHRSHQAVYLDRLLNAGIDDWAICGVGLQVSDEKMYQALTSQDCLYSVCELDNRAVPKVTVVGAICDFLYAPSNPQAVLNKLADASTKIVSLTITEGGYNVDDNSGQFNLTHPDIQHDLTNPLTPITVFGYLTQALWMRREAGIAPFTVMSCDNLPGNGDVTRLALSAFAMSRDEALAKWITEQVSFPNSMVDRITPMTPKAHSQWLKDEYGLEDEWPVVCEPFLQWVLEDDFCNGRPDLQSAGVQFSDNVISFELLKIRLLNASHSALAYLGYMQGFEYCHEVMDQQYLKQFIQDFMDQDVSPFLIDTAKQEGIDLQAYKDNLIHRFANTQMADQLSRLCLDGSSKMPKFILPTIELLIKHQKPLDRVALIIASWAFFLRQTDLADIQDPQASALKQAVARRDSLALTFLSMPQIFGEELVKSNAFITAFEQSLATLESLGVEKAVRALS